MRKPPAPGPLAVQRMLLPEKYLRVAGCTDSYRPASGLAVERLERTETEPEYLAFHVAPYALGVAYERLVNRISALARLRVNLLFVGRKQST